MACKFCCELERDLRRFDDEIVFLNSELYEGGLSEGQLRDLRRLIRAARLERSEIGTMFDRHVTVHQSGWQCYFENAC